MSDETYCKWQECCGRRIRKTYTVKDTVSHADLLPFLHGSLEFSFSLLHFPNNSKYSQRAKCVPRTKKYSYEKDIMSDLRKIQSRCKNK